MVLVIIKCGPSETEIPPTNFKSLHLLLELEGQNGKRCSPLDAVAVISSKRTKSRCPSAPPTFFCPYSSQKKELTPYLVRS